MNKSFLSLVIAAALGITFLIWKGASRVPKQGELAEQASTEVNDDSDLIIEKALLLLQSGEGSPMEAIGMIRGILEKNPEHIKANLTLGSLSFSTGQYDRAIQRMRVVNSVQPDNQDAILILADSYAAMKNLDSAKYFYDALLNLKISKTDSMLIESKINELLTL